MNASEQKMKSELLKKLMSEMDAYQGGMKGKISDDPAASMPKEMAKRDPNDKSFYMNPTHDDQLDQAEHGVDANPKAHREAPKETPKMEDKKEEEDTPLSWSGFMNRKG